MPKSKVRKKPDYTLTSTPANRTPVKVKGGPSSPLYLIVMFGLMVIGLLWLLVFYLAGDSIGWMSDLDAWNFLIGFGFMVAGLIMTMGWK